MNDPVQILLERLTRALLFSDNPYMHLPDVAVSAIISTRNRPQMLRRAVQTVCNQSLDALEIIVVDDASDPSVRLSDLPPDTRLRLLRHEVRRGAAAARNSGLKVAKGEHVAFLDDDDEWLPQKLESQLRKIQDSGPDVVLVTCAFRVVSDLSGAEIRTANPPFETDLSQLLNQTPFPTSIPLIRRQVVQQVGGFDESLEGAQDRDLWLRLRAHGEFGFTPELGVIKHAHENQISTRLDLKLGALGYLLKKHHQLYRRNRPAHAHELGRLGLMQCAAGDRLRGCRALLYSFAVNPRNFKSLSDLFCQLLSARPAREAHLRNAFIQRDGACRYF